MAGINSVTNSTSSTSNTTANDAAISSQLGPSAFLTLLTTELANQDPLNPVDQTQSLAQLAQFSTLQSQDNLATSFQSFQNQSSVAQAASLLGQNVEASVTNGAGTTSYVTGTIQAVQIVSGVPQFTLVNPTTGAQVVDSGGNPITITEGQIVGIGGSSSTSTSSSGRSSK